MEAVLGASPAEFIFVTLFLAGGAALLTGQVTAEGWHGWWRLAPYVLLLTLASRFLHFALFDGDMLAPVGVLVDLAWITLLSGLSWAATRASKMVRQYPWLYERSGPFGWRERRG